MKLMKYICLLLCLGIAGAAQAQFNPTNPPEPGNDRYYKVAVTADPASGGSVSASPNNARAGQSVTLSASPYSGYKFVEWRDSNDRQVSTSQSTRITMGESDASYKAIFRYAPTNPSEPSQPTETAQVTLSVNPANGGSVSGAGRYNVGSTVRISASTRSGYIFTGWTRNGELIGTSSSMSYQVTADNNNLVANFKYSPANPGEPTAPVTKNRLNLVSNPPGAATFNISSVTQQTAGTRVYVVANPRSGYILSNWTDEDGNTLSADKGFYFTMPDRAVTLTANVVYSPSSPSEPSSPSPKRNIIYGAREQAMPGSGLIYTISLENVDAVTGLNIDVTSPEGLRFDFDSAVLGSRAGNHTLSNEKVSDSTYRLLVRGTEALTGANGPVIRIPVTIPADAEPGTLIDIEVSRGVIYRADGTQDPVDTSNGSVKIVALPETVPDSPDFFVSNITVDGGELMPGDPVTVGWTVENAGTLDAAAGWSESVFLVDENGSRTMLGTVYYDTDAMAKGEKVARTATFNIATLPGLSGKLNAGVSLTPYATSGELDQFQTNNTTIGEGFPVTLGKRLTIELPETVTEGTDHNIRGRVARSGSWSESESFDINIIKADDRLYVPSSVTIAANQSAAYFQATLSDNNEADSNSSAIIEIGGNGYDSASAEIVIVDDELPALALEASTDSVNEGETFILTVRLPFAAVEDTELRLGCDYPGRFTFENAVILKAGQSEMSLDVKAIDNNSIEGNQDVTFFVSANGYEDGETFVLLTDDDMPSLELTITPAEVSENAGPTAMHATIIRTSNFTKKVTVIITDDASKQLLYPTERIELAAGQKSAEFTIGVVDNTIVDGDRDVTVTAAVYISSCNCSAAGESGGSVSKTIRIIDNDGPSLTLNSRVSVIPEGDDNGVSLTISRNTDVSAPLTVTLSSDADDVLIYDHTVTIPAGQSETSVIVKAPANSETDDSRTIVFTAEADGFAKSTFWMMLSDRSLPDAVISDIKASATTLNSGSSTEVSITVTNSGSTTLPEQLPVTLYLINDPLAQLYTQSPLEPGESVTLTKNVTLPDRIGSFDLYAVANEQHKIAELIYTNNNSLRVKLDLTARFKATASVDRATVEPNGAVTISGKADGDFAAGDEIEVYVINQGARQTVTATLAADGSYKAEFKPYAAQIGHFAVGACCPGEKLLDEMTGFDILGLKREGSVALTCDGTVGQTSTISLTISNPSSIDLTGVNATVSGQREGCRATATVANTIAGGSSATVSVILEADNASTTSNWEQMKLDITTAEGTSLSETVYYFFRNSRGTLTADVTNIETNISMGGTIEVPVTVTNTGGGETGRISVALPEWITLSSQSTLPSLKPGASVTVPLVMTTNDKMNLNYALTGNIGINCENGSGVIINYNVTPVTEEKGFVKIEACDEYTYYTAEKPKVSGASVKIKHPSTGAVITDDITGEDGTLTIELPGGYYQLEVTAAKHDTYSDFVFVSPGKTETVTADISYNPITISWDVKETEIEDEYLIETTCKYETNVPMPVVKMTIPKSIDGDNMAVGDATMINMNLTNLGLIKATEVCIIMPDEEEWLFEPLDHNEPFDLNPQESVNIPIRITRIADTSQSHKARRRSAADTMYDSYKGCMTHLAETYKAICGKKLKDNTAAESMSMKMCATSATLAAVAEQIGKLTEKLSIPLLNTGGGGGMAAGGGGGGGYNGPVGGTNSFTICDPCDAEKAERVIDHLVGQAGPGISMFWDALSKAVKRHQEGGRTIKVVIKHIGEKTSESVEDYALDNVKGGKLLGLAADIVEITKPCENEDGDGSGDGSNDAPRPRMKAKGSKDWMDEFNTEADRFVGTLNVMDSLMMIGFGDRIWFDDIDQGKVDFINYALSLPEGEIPSDDDIRLHKPESVSFEQAKDYILYLNADESDLPSIDTMDQLADEFSEAEDYAGAKGYSSMVQLFDAAYTDYVDHFERMKTQSVCASITLKISQRMTMTRQAFRGSLSVFNGHDSKPMKDVRLNLIVRDEDGNVATSRQFQINLESLDGFGGNVMLDAGWTLDAGTTGDASILFIPSKYAAPDADKVYSFGGSISYVDPYTDLVVTRTLYPVSLTVKPSPSLDLTYFMQRDIHSDDPLTPDVVEPSYPSEFALVINNKGYGNAENVRMVTQQPEITDNEKGLLIDFEIESSQLNGQEKVLSLGGSMATDFGTIEARTTAYAQWWLKSSLLGHFTDYDVEATHITSYGNPDLSLLDNVEIHELIHGLTISSGDKPARAFVVNDIKDADDMPDMVYFSDGSEHRELTIATSATLRRISDNAYEIDIVPSADGWTYASVEDPTGCRQNIAAIVRRSDGMQLPADNAWQTAVTLIDGSDPVHESKLHIAGDIKGNETYLLTFEPRPDVELAVSQIAGVTQDELLTAPLQSVTVSFNKAIDPTTFTVEDLTLTLAGNKCDLKGADINQVNSTDYRVTLGDATQSDGYYVLTVNTLDITDAEGYNGKNGKSIAWIQAIDGKVMLTVNKEPAEGGSVSRASSRVDLNSAVTLTATAAEGYDFSEWLRGGSSFSDNPVIDHVMTSDETFTAVFVPKRYAVEVEYDPTQGYVTNGGSGIYEHGDELELLAVANIGYAFKNWLVNGDDHGNDPQLTVKVAGPTTIRAIFTDDVTTGIDDACSDRSFSVSPAVLHDLMTVDGTFANISTLSVLSPSGAVLRQWHDVARGATVDVLDLPEGFFIVHAVTDNGIYVKKVLKR